MNAFNQHVLIGLGSNLGSRIENLSNGIREVALALCAEHYHVSDFYWSKSWGYQSQLNYVNACLYLKTHQIPHDILKHLQEIENNFGRQASSHQYTDRPLDLDILFVNKTVVNTPALTLPHPKLLERDFVLKPLLDLRCFFNHFDLDIKSIQYQLKTIEPYVYARQANLDI